MTRARESKGVKYNEQYMIVMAGMARECAYFPFLLIQHQQLKCEFETHGPQWPYRHLFRNLTLQSN